MKSYIVITDNSEKYIHDVLCSLLPLSDNEELIIFDNHSTDETVPIIVGTMGILWIEEGYKFYINTKKCTYEETKQKALSIAKGKPIIIEEKKKFEIKEVVENA